MQNNRGPLCSSNVGAGWVDVGTMARTRAAPPVLNPSHAESEEERQLMLDLTQMTLDIVGIVDPTPAADGSNLAISLGRKDWIGAGLSAVSMIPYLGDAAKVGKLGRWAQTVEGVVRMAIRRRTLAAKVRPVLRNLAALLEQVPLRLLPSGAQAVLVRMKGELTRVLGRPVAHGAVAAIALKRKLLFRFIDAIELPPPGMNNGVLWSRIGEAGIDGATLAARKAADGQKTLEMTLEKSGFEKAYQLAAEQLKQTLNLSDAEVWESLGRDAWQRVSLRYTQTLQGRITAYVRFSPRKAGQSGINVLSGAYDPLKDPILFDELEAIGDAMLANPRITSVKLTSVDDAKEFKLLEREMLLRALRATQ